MSTRPRPSAGEERSGLLLLRGGLLEVAAWVRRGVVPAAVVPMEGWTAVLPGERSCAQEPYTDGALLLAGRHIPRKLGPALGFWIVQGRAVITVQTRGRRGIRWVVWEPERGIITPSDLAVAGPVTLQRVAGAGTRSELVEILHERYVAPDRLLAAVVAVLELPGARLLVDASGVAQLPGAISVLPAPREVGYFNDAVRDAVTLREELEA